MNIWLLQIGEPYPFMNGARLMRTGLLCEQLVAQGHHVLWWGSTFYHPRKQVLDSNEVEKRVGSNCRIKLLQGKPYKKNISISRYIHHQKITNRFNRLAAEESKPDLIVASLPLHNLANAAVKYGQKNGIPVVIDIRDLWPDFFISKLPSNLRQIGRVLLNDEFEKTKFALTNANAIISISNSYMSWGLSYANRSRNHQRDKIFYIGSQALKSSEVKQSESTNSNLENCFSELDNKTVFGFIGTFGNTYDLKIILEAAEYLESSQNDDIHFVIAGDGEQRQEIEKLSEKLSNVSLIGWLNNDQIVEFLTRIDVGLAPYRKDAPQSLPNKPFQYLAAGIPMISSLQGELSDILKDKGIGLTYEPENRESFVKKIQTLARNADKISTMSDNANAAFKESFDANSIYKQMVLYLESLIKDKEL